MTAVVDSVYYGRFVLSWLNIVKYNVLSGKWAKQHSLFLIQLIGAGPNLYGVEPWHFYVRNLLLNFNVLVGAALLAPVVRGFAFTGLLILTPCSCSNAVDCRSFCDGIATACACVLVTVVSLDRVHGKFVCSPAT